MPLHRAPDAPPVDHDLLRRARLALMDDADRMRAGGSDFPSMSRDEWETRADASEAGQLVGPREIDAIGALVFGRRRFRR